MTTHDAGTEGKGAAGEPVPHPIVRAYLETGRKAVFLGDHAEIRAQLSRAPSARSSISVSPLAPNLRGSIVQNL